MNKKMTFIQLLRDMDKPLFFVSMAFFIFGLLNIVTASSRAAVVNYDVSIYYYFYKQLIFVVAGLLFFGVLIIRTDTIYYKLFIFPIFIIAVALNIWALTFPEIGGSTNWIDLGPIKIQPSELSKPVIILTLALLFEKYYKKLRTVNIKHYDIIGRIILISSIIPLIVVRQKDLGTLLIIMFIIFVLFIASPILRIDKFKSLLVALGLISLGVLVLYLKQGYILNDARKSRFTSFLDPCGNYENGGYQVCNGYIAINNGGMFGLGIGKSKQKYSYIPEPHTDSAFAIIAEEYGVIKTVFIFIGYLIILSRIFSISSNASTIRGRYICFGVGCFIFAHIFINLGGMFGVIPLTGVPLPFLSYGGSFVISIIVGLSLVQRVCIETKNQKIKIR